MKIRDNETGEVFEYGTNRHHALRISKNGGCLTFENLQNGDGGLKSGDGGYSFVLDDGKTPEESVSLDAVNGSTYANIGGFYEENSKNDDWIPVEERLPEAEQEHVLACRRDGSIDTARYSPYSDRWYVGSMCSVSLDVIAWRPLPEPYRPERRTSDD